MRKLLFGLIVLTVTSTSFAGLGRIDLYFIKDVAVNVGNSTVTQDVCLADVTCGGYGDITGGTFHFLIIADGSPMSDYMIALLMNKQSTSETTNIVYETDNNTYYTGGTRSNTLYPPANTYVLLKALNFIDNQI